MEEVARGRGALVAHLVRDIGRTAAQHALFSQAVAAELDIAPTDLECLSLLQDAGPASAGQLAEVLNLTTGAITGVIDRLVAAGFVVRESDPADRRRVIVQPVAARTIELDAAYAPVRAALARAVTHISEDDLRTWLDFEARTAAVFEDAARQLKSETQPASQFSAPLRETRLSSLEFASGARAVAISAIAGPSEALYDARFDGVQPVVRVQGGAITVRYRRLGMFEWGGAKPSGSVALNPAVPWQLRLRGGVAEVRVDASALRLRGLSVSDGANKFELKLPAPEGHVEICLEGGINRVHIVHPHGTLVELRVQGGANRLEFGTQRFGAVGGDIRLATPGWEQAADRYAIHARGGASRLVVGERDA